MVDDNVVKMWRRCSDDDAVKAHLAKNRRVSVVASHRAGPVRAPVKASVRDQVTGSVRGPVRVPVEGPVRAPVQASVRDIVRGQERGPARGPVRQLHPHFPPTSYHALRGVVKY